MVLEKLLNCDNLSPDWWRFYGLTQSKGDALLAKSNHSDSFFNPKSETALTLFMLGNIDGWKQIGRLKIVPRNKDSRWNRAFFDGIRESRNFFDKTPSKDILWGCHDDLAEGDLQRSILLFEFEILNSAFHSVGGKLFKDLSFLDISDMKKWSRFDAVLILPTEKLFIFFESKFTSDLSQNTKKYSYVNQVIRNLEAAYLLTNHKNSLYKDWSFKYVLICPRKAHQYKLTCYSHVLDAIEDHISIYKEVIENEYKSRINPASYPKYFEAFEREVPNCVSRIYWDELGEILKMRNQNFFIDYFERLEDAEFDEKNIDGVKQRFVDVGLNIS